MKMVRPLLLIVALSAVGCSTTSGYASSKGYAGTRCPAGTILICMDTRRYCHCGEVFFD